MRAKKFNLIEMIFIVIIVSCVSMVSTGIVLNSGNGEIICKNTDENINSFLKVYNSLKDNYYDNNIDYKSMIESAEQAMINFVGDKYTTYLDEDEYNTLVGDLQGSYTGIGISIQDNKIVSVVEDSPASTSGMMVGDLIISINGTNVEKMSSDEMANILKQSTSDLVTIVIKRDEEYKTIETKKDEIESGNTMSKIISTNGVNIGYIYIKNFPKNLKEQVSNDLKKLEEQEINSLIIDLRGNSGGYLSSAESVSSLFLKKNKIIYYLENSGNTYIYKDKTKESRNYKIAILINGGTASSAEILASALRESYGAILVGTKSYGKGLVQQISTLDSGNSVKYTTAKWLTPTGECINEIGLYPDYEVIFDDTLEEDNQLNKAIELLS